MFTTIPSQAAGEKEKETYVKVGAKHMKLEEIAKEKVALMPLGKVFVIHLVVGECEKGAE